MRKLTRSASDRMVAGVCGGVGEYFGWHTDAVRILWITSLILGGVGVLPYVAGIFLLPEGEGPRGPAPSAARVAGYVLLGLGILFLLRTFEARVLDPTVLAFWKLRALGPVLLLTAGGLLVWPRGREFLRPAGRRPHRSLSDRVLGGVAGGLARELTVDSNVVRLAFVSAAALTFGLAVLVYLLLAFVLPEEAPHGAPGPAERGAGPSAGAEFPGGSGDPGDQASSGGGR